MATERQRFLITLEAEPGDKWAGRRLAKWLKAALRSYRLRCVDARELPAHEMGRTADAATARPSISRRTSEPMIPAPPNPATG